MITNSIALIGGGGFIGTNLVNFFMHENYKLLIAGRSINESFQKDDNIDKIIIDVNKTSSLINELYNYENIVWLVNDLVPSSTMDSLVDDFNFNVSPLINFLESAHKLPNLKRFIYISSGGTIYGDSFDFKPITECNDLNPISAYGLSKKISEQYIHYITKKSIFQSFIIRPSNVYGDFQNLKKPQGIVGYAFNSIINNTPIDVYGEGIVIRDFVHVLDLANALKLCIESKFVKSNINIYNVGSQEGVSIKQILEFISELTGSNIQIFVKPERSFDCKYNVLDINKIKTELYWQPNINIKDGLESLWANLNFKKNKSNI